MSKYRVFYNCESTGCCVPSADAQVMELEYAASLSVTVLLDDEDFFGLTDSAGVTLQFLKEAAGIWMEMPRPSERGSYGRHVGLDEVHAIIEGLKDTLNVEEMTKFEFRRWY